MVQGFDLGRRVESGVCFIGNMEGDGLLMVHGPLKWFTVLGVVAWGRIGHFKGVTVPSNSRVAMIYLYMLDRGIPPFGK